MGPVWMLFSVVYGRYDIKYFFKCYEIDQKAMHVTALERR